MFNLLYCISFSSLYSCSVPAVCVIISLYCHHLVNLCSSCFILIAYIHLLSSYSSDSLLKSFHNLLFQCVPCCVSFYYICLHVVLLSLKLNLQFPKLVLLSMLTSLYMPLTKKIDLVYFLQYSISLL